jgi:hypothetical protein
MLIKIKQAQEKTNIFNNFISENLKQMMLQKARIFIKMAEFYLNSVI